MVKCAACAENGRGEAPAVAFVKRRQWGAGQFVDAGVYPLCLACLTRRQEMNGNTNEVPWDEAFSMWSLQQVHES